MMDPKIKSDWLKALRSGQYPQTTLYMKDDRGFCCLGVLCAIQGETFEAWTTTSLATSRVCPEYAAGLAWADQNVLASKNDKGCTFAQIADHIEETY